MAARPTQHPLTSKSSVRLSGKGKVLSYTIVADAPEGFEEQAPYVLAIIRLDEGPLITSQLTDLEVQTGPVSIGMRVEMVTRKLRTEGPQGTIIYGYKFRPIL